MTYPNEGCSHGFIGFCDACYEKNRLVKRDEKIVELEAEIHSLFERDLDDLRNLAKNLCWMAQTVHQSSHGNDAGTWKECNKGVCGSMEHMLAQSGLDKDLKPVERVP